MKLLEDKIKSCGKTVGSDIVKVDMFLNHQVDPVLMHEIGKEFKRLFENEGITKVLTIEVSGIAPAVFAALELNVPLVFAKKNEAKNLDASVYSADFFSFTKNKTYTIRVSKDYLSKDDKVLLIDDFLANGKALLGMLDIVKQAGAETKGIGIVIEKGFQPGGKEIRDMGYRVESLAIISSIADGVITFAENNC